MRGAEKRERLETRLEGTRGGWVKRQGELRDNCVQRNSLAVMLEMTRRKFDRQRRLRAGWGF